MIYIVFTSILAFSLTTFFIKIYKRNLIKIFYKFKEKHNYNTKILPLGGLTLIILFLLNYQYFNFHIIIASIVLFFLGFCSDLKIIKSPYLRFILMLIPISIFIYYSNLSISSNNFPVIGELIENKLFNFIFLLTCILIIVNGCNFIDGVNNNLNIYFILFNLTVIYLKYINDINLDHNIVFLVFSVIFFFFNYKNILMAGDSGSYLVGFISSVEAVMITNQIENLSKYFAILLLAYPSYEVLFSMIRKRKNNFFFPDGKHLHLLLIKFNKKNHIKTSFQLNFINLIIFFIGIYFSTDDIVLITLIFSYIITYNYFHNYLSR